MRKLLAICLVVLAWVPAWAQQSTLRGGGGTVTGSVSTTNTLAYWTNFAGDLALQVQPATNRFEINVGDTTVQGCTWFWNPYHPNELQIASSGSISLNPGYDSTGAGVLQIGSSGAYHDAAYLQYDLTVSGGSTLGYSKPLGFATQFYSNSTANYVYPNIQGVAKDVSGNWVLRFSDGARAGNAPQFTGGAWAVGALWGEIGPTWNQRGGLMQQLTPVTTTASSYALPFNSSVFVDISASAASVALSTTGIPAGSTNASRRVFYLRSGANSPSYTYPTTWNTNGTALPASVAAANVMRLELEAIGGQGESNVTVVSAMVLQDHTFTWDQDALDFLGRASISVAAQSNAVNQLVVNAKAHSWWTKCDAIYPFVGGGATAHSKNLKANTFNITWAGTVTHDANGVTGNGSTGYGATGFIPKSNGTAYLINSAHLFVYGGTTAPTDGTTFMGCYRWSGTSTRSGLLRSGVSLAATGLNQNDNPGASLGASTDFRGPMAAIRTSSTVENVYVRALVGTTGSTVTVEATDAAVGILARVDHSGSADQFSNANLRGATIGGAMTQAEWDVFRADWETYEAALSRTAP